MDPASQLAQLHQGLFGFLGRRLEERSEKRSTYGDAGSSKGRDLSHMLGPQLVMGPRVDVRSEPLLRVVLGT